MQKALAPAFLEKVVVEAAMLHMSEAYYRFTNKVFLIQVAEEEVVEELLTCSLQVVLVMSLYQMRKIIRNGRMSDMIKIDLILQCIGLNYL
jgi:hypothetical protein